MNALFETAIPETLGIPSEALQNFLTRLEKQELPLHSAIIMRHNQICMETYYAPYTKDSLHRMFSITKSFVSLAIGLLQEEGRISLSDHIVDYFPEKQPANGPFPYTQMLTIAQMLAMTTCHDKTTYKMTKSDDWTATFFTTPPSHIPGTNFSYDTSSTHTLCALVEKLTGMELLDYLRMKFLDALDFSKDAYILKDPVGVSMGGSGLCCTSRDILKVIYCIGNKGNVNGKQLLPEAYVKLATKIQSDPRGKQGTLEEMQGYGYQIWKTRHNGSVLFGMGGQLALYVPDKDIFMVTTADAQGRQGGVQLIYDAFWEELYNHISPAPLPENAAAYERLCDYANTRTLYVLPGMETSPMEATIDGVVYDCDDNPCGITNLTVSFSKTSGTDTIKEGTLTYENETGTHQLTFGMGHNCVQQFPDYHLQCAISAAWSLEATLLIKVQIIDSAVGNMYISLNFKDHYVTAMFRKIEESLFNEYNGVFSGQARNLDVTKPV